jgi:hypothetical protein
LFLKMAREREGDALRLEAFGGIDDDKERGCEACAGLCQIGVM